MLPPPEGFCQVAKKARGSGPDFLIFLIVIPDLIGNLDSASLQRRAGKCGMTEKHYLLLNAITFASLPSLV